GIDAHLVNHGIFMKSNLSVIKETHFNLLALIHFASTEALGNLTRLVIVLSTRPYFGSPILFVLVIIGLLTRKPGAEFIINQIFLLMPIAITSLSLLSMYRMDTRYALPYLPVMIIWAGQGLLSLSQWGASLVRVGGLLSMT